MQAQNESFLVLENVLGRSLAIALDHYQYLCEQVAQQEINDLQVWLSPSVSIQATDAGMRLNVENKPSIVFAAYNAQGKHRDWQPEFNNVLSELGLSGPQAIFQWGQEQTKLLESAKVTEDVCLWSADFTEMATFTFTHPFTPSKTLVGIRVLDTETGKERRKLLGKITDKRLQDFASPFTSPLSAKGAMVLMEKLGTLSKP